MQLDPNELADLIAETVVDAVRPMQKQIVEQQVLIADLQRRLESVPDARAIVIAELEKIPTSQNGKDVFDADEFCKQLEAAANGA